MENEKNIARSYCEAIEEASRSREAYERLVAEREELLEDYYEDSPKVKDCERRILAEAARYPKLLAEVDRLSYEEIDNIDREIDRCVNVEGMRADGRTVRGLKAKIYEIERNRALYPKDVAAPERYEDAALVYSLYTESQRRAKQDREAWNATLVNESKERWSTSWGGESAGERRALTIAGCDYFFCWCPSGAFDMGSPEDEDGRNEDETLHSVVLPRGFWILESQTTQRLWTDVMGANPSRFQGDALPVEQVSWEDCRAFVDRLNSMNAAPDETIFDLPTEAEWEYACRAGETGPYNGPSLKEIAWYFDNCERRAHDVKGKRPNAWNIYDMHGNVWEWCADWYGEYSSETEIDPSGPESGEYRVLRGGGWYGDEKLCRCAYRHGDKPTNREATYGFRLVLRYGV